MNTPVDVLAVMDGAIDHMSRASESRGDDMDAETLKEARAAVIDVLDAADHLTSVIGFRIDDPRVYRLDALRHAVANARGQ